MVEKISYWEYYDQVLQRKTEECAAATRRLNELLESRKALSRENSGKFNSFINSGESYCVCPVLFVSDACSLSRTEKITHEHLFAFLYLIRSHGLIFLCCELSQSVLLYLIRSHTLSFLCRDNSQRVSCYISNQKPWVRFLCCENLSR